MKVRRTWKRTAYIVLMLGAVPVFFVIFKIGSSIVFQPTPRVPAEQAVYLDASQPIEARVADLLSYMTLEEKIGQMALVERNSLASQDDIATYYLGALLSGAGSKPEDNSVAGWRTMIDGYQATAKETRLGIPLLYGADAVHGHAHVAGVTVFPHAIGLGASGDAEMVQVVAVATAAEVAATGVNWSYSPNLDMPQDIRWGRVYEAFSDDPVLVSTLGTAYLKGLQNSAGGVQNIFVLGTPKHFLGLGAMEWGTSQNKNFHIDQGVTPADPALLRDVYVPPFAAAIEAGALSIMVGLNTWGDERMVRQKELLTGTLKGELGYKGFLVSDWYGVHEGRLNIFWATVEAINAGVDMVMLPFDYKTFARHVAWANRLGFISDARIDDAVGRILYAKFALGLFDGVSTDEVVTKASSIAHRTLAREAVASSLVLLKNENATLPLSANVPAISVAGSAADNVGRQMGAWSIEWQGIDGVHPDGTTSILDGIRAAVGQKTVVRYDERGDFPVTSTKTPVGIAVVGEKPYAEGWGDTAYPVLGDDDLQAIKNLQLRCERVVVVVVSGRPLLMENEVDSFDALVAAWLPGSEGSGVADVLFGERPFTGTLPLPWPARSEQLPLAINGTTADGTAVMFPRYFGLRY